jgi:hypothetical protein
MRSSHSPSAAVPPRIEASQPLPLAFTVVLSAALVAVTLFGLLADSAYRVSPGVRDVLPATLKGQDLLTLLTVPVLIWSARRAQAGVLAMHLVWLGLLLYYAYSYVLYAFAPFTDVFLGYCLIIGMSGYGFLNGLLRLDMRAIAPTVTAVPRRGLGVFLLVVAGAFLGLWLSMIVPAIPGGLPEGRMTYDIASAVHVLDLSVMLPLVAGTGWLLLRAHPAGPVLGVVLLCKIITLALAMSFMNLVYLDSPNPGELVLWCVIGAVAGAMLVLTLRRMPNPTSAWIRPGLWR